MATTTELSCDGFVVGSVLVPPFEIVRGDYVGLAYPAEYAEEWDLMQILGGVHPTPHVRLTAQSSIIAPPGCGASKRTRRNQSVFQFLTASGVESHVAQSIVTDLGLAPDLIEHDLQLTPKLMLQIALAFAQGVGLVVFSTAGLDPLGVMRVASLVATRGGQRAAISVFSAELLEYYESSGGFTQVIKCFREQ